MILRRKEKSGKCKCNVMVTMYWHLFGVVIFYDFDNDIKINSILSIGEIYE